VERGRTHLSGGDEVLEAAADVAEGLHQAPQRALDDRRGRRRGRGPALEEPIDDHRHLARVKRLDEILGSAGLDRPDGRVETCKPQHSWNSNHLFSNWATFHLQRHSDHHAHPLRRYQSLRHFDEAPQLPSGYFGMFPIAYVPPLWFSVMDRRLLEAVGRDPARINFAPGQRERLTARHGLVEHAVRLE
jgi:hypothetical protein